MRWPHLRLLAAVTLAFALAAPLPGQPVTRDQWADAVRQEIEVATLSTELPRLTAARTLVERALAAFPDDPLLQHYHAYALWREASLLLGADRSRAARPLLERADALLERSARQLPLPETYALRASVTGQLIATSRNPLAAVRLGPRSMSLMEQAEKAGPRNPRVWLLKGIGSMHMPAMMGGGLDKAQAHLERALALYATDRPEALLPAWGEAEVHVYLGQVHARQGRPGEARAAYARALVLQPDNAWVRRGLLPALGEAGGS